MLAKPEPAYVMSAKPTAANITLEPVHVRSPAIWSPAKMVAMLESQHQKFSDFQVKGHLLILLSLSTLLLSLLFTLSLALLGTEIVGGKGGDEFSFKSTFDSAISKIIITYNEVEGDEMAWFYSRYATLNTIQVIFQNYQMVRVG
ncbi:hypothetical protein Q8A67_001440 [Cirrhinus molitorella]|uniref:Uncharacterized protein n=1 Tax=Cirrhinus molitorella TaxID=172907 RepID=A0AA88U7M0_9TELE|nr:hypothetical protein Q8A67_001440 [Cirrhinus molitorella]